MSFSKPVTRSHFLTLVLGVGVFLPGCDRAPEGAGYPKAKWVSRTVAGGYENGRQGTKIDRIILYTTEHPAERARKLWRDSGSLSGHYMVTCKGQVWQFLKDADAGWHAGNREYNLRSIAIAVEGFADPHNPENPTQDLAWQTEEELEALAHLMQWLCARYQIPVDRAHIIGKNQVPGVRTESYPLSGPEYWGGASNKSAPGATWNWRRFMEKMGRKPVHHTLRTTTNCVVTTLPENHAPVIATLPGGRELEAYDRDGDFWLVLVTEPSVAQPYLPAGRHHWDGWVEAKLVETVSAPKPGPTNP